MPMSKEDATAIIDIVANDAESLRRIRSNLDSIIPPSWGIAGGLRNAGYVLMNMASFGNYADPTEKEFADRVCTGIADATSDAINKAIKSKDARIRNIQRAITVDRNHNRTAHTATGVITVDGAEHVLDWHATLDEKNPMLYRYLREWKENKGGIPFSQFSGWK